MSVYRLNRLFNPQSGRALDVAVDHGFFGERSFLTDIEDMDAVVRTLVDANPDAVQLTVGHARLLQAVPGRQKPALVLRSDVANVYGNLLDEHLFSHHLPNAIEEAVRLDAVAICANLMQLPGRPEIREANICSIMALRAEATRYAMPLMSVVGGGLMGREIAAALQRWPALIDHLVRPQLTAICDINPAALDWFDQIPTVTHKATDYTELLSDDAIDVLYIAVRHDLHQQLYVDTIQAGKSLLAEKPFGIDAAAAAAIMAAASANPQSFVRCSSEMPFFPGAQAAINYVRSGASGKIIEARCAFLHASDLDVNKPINWKRQARYCGEAGVMNDLGLHVWHVPLRLGWAPDRVFGILQDIVTERPSPNGGRERCDTWDNGVIHGWVSTDGYSFPLTTEMKRIDPGEKNTWEFEALGLDGGVRFSTKNPKRVEVFSIVNVPGDGREQVWSALDAGSQSVWPTVTGPNFESGFSDAILQMLAAFLAEREGALGDRFGCATPEEATLTHAIYRAAIRSHETGAVVREEG